MTFSRFLRLNLLNSLLQATMKELTSDVIEYLKVDIVFQKHQRRKRRLTDLRLYINQAIHTVKDSLHTRTTIWTAIM